MSTVLLDGTEQLINGLMYGCFYALIGGGFTLLFGVLRRFNLAYGSTIMAGAYAGLIPVYLFNAPVLVLFVTTIVVSVLVGLLVEFCCFRFLRKGHELAPLMTTIGMLIVIDETIVYLTDAVGLKYPAPFGDESLALGPFLIRPDYLAILVVSVVSFSAIFYLLYRTRFGRAMRAVAERPDAAQILGVSVRHVNVLTFVLTSALAGIIGFFAAVSVGSARPEMAAWLTGKGLVVMVLGGLGSFPGAIVGGLALGVLEFEAVWFLGSSYRDILAFAILFLVLIVRPGGLLGTRTA
ncbi:MAG: branched-chain amino acid ABC transporter permease [Candidatus Rokuibacteriota bacterium]|nr:MAG: branched-chain amino acid ABC transporter permease [Candidatus Rokubacteria bacterium]PYN68540.1 MAG: branched-chain amino acid ABC transporter permease [Candidatus Rokubacteria bacterium]